jgi:hypothetical protein
MNMATLGVAFIVYDDVIGPENDVAVLEALTV